jgi:riboflavin-specific deaminase-like protein
MRPHVSANFALTWDGRISTRRRTPSDFSSPRDKRRLLEIRSAADAVLATPATVAADNMTMGMPVAELREERLVRGQAEYPLRVLVSNSGRIDPGMRLFQKQFSPIVIFSTTRMPARTRRALSENAELHLTEADQVDLLTAMQTLHASYGVRRVDSEGGGRLFRSLLLADLLDEIHVTFCPRIFGGEKAPTLTGIAGEYLPHSVACSLESMEMIEDECFLRYRVLRSESGTTTKG